MTRAIHKSNPNKLKTTRKGEDFLWPRWYRILRKDPKLIVEPKQDIWLVVVDVCLLKFDLKNERR